MSRYSAIVLPFLLGVSVAVAQDAGSSGDGLLSCEKDGEWQLIPFGIPGPPGKLSVTTAPGTFKEGKGAMELQYNRKPGQLQILNAPLEMAGFRTIEFDLYSQVETSVGVLVEDQNGARFHHAAQTQAGEWKHLVLTAADFKLNDDSPVKAAALDPALIKPSFSITDAASLFGATGPNVLRIDALRVGREALKKLEVPASIAGRTVTLTENGHVATPVKIGRGGTLRVTATRVVWSASVSLEGGTLEFDGANMALQGRFPHDVTWTAGPGSTIRLTNGRLSGNVISKIEVQQGARLEMNGVECAAPVLTVDLQNGSVAQVDGTKRVGEFTVAAKARTRFAKCEGLMVWLAPAKAEFPMPNGAYVLMWSPPPEAGMDLGLSACSGMLWGFLSFPGSRLSFQDGDFRGAGLVFGGNTRETLANMKNDAPMIDFQMRLADRELKLLNCNVKAWNLYAAGASNLTIRDSVVGEVFALGNARVTMVNSTCDGTGGYVRIEGRAQVKLTTCGLTCDVVVADDARVTLDDCKISGALRVMGRARVDLNRSEVQGGIEKMDQGVVNEKP